MRCWSRHRDAFGRRRIHLVEEAPRAPNTPASEKDCDDRRRSTKRIVQGVALVMEIDSSTLQSTPRKARPSRDRLSGAVTKADIARAICGRTPSVSLRHATSLIDAIIEEIVLTLAADEPLRLRDFGLFLVRRKSERPGRNPRNRVAATVSARRAVIFRASSKLKAAVANRSRAQSTKSSACASRRRPREDSHPAN